MRAAAAAGGAGARREVPAAGHIRHGHRLGKLLPSQLCLRASAPARLLPSPRVQKTCDFGFGLDVPDGRTPTFGANVVESTLRLGVDAASDANQRQLHGGGRKHRKLAKKKAKPNVQRPWKPGGNFRLPSDQVRATAQARPPACAGCHVCAPP